MLNSLLQHMPSIIKLAYSCCVAVIVTGHLERGINSDPFFILTFLLFAGNFGSCQLFHYYPNFKLVQGSVDQSRPNGKATTPANRSISSRTFGEELHN